MVNSKYIPGGQNYNISKCIGKGGYALVYACEPCIDADEDSMELESFELVLKVKSNDD
jgi:hypothetical protein